jgi:hypothetical protein
MKNKERKVEGIEELTEVPTETLEEFRTILEMTSKNLKQFDNRINTFIEERLRPLLGNGEVEVKFPEGKEFHFEEYKQKGKVVGYICAFGGTEEGSKECDENFFDIGEINLHLEEVHDVPFDKQLIPNDNKWTKEEERKAAEYVAKHKVKASRARKAGKEPEEGSKPSKKSEEELEDMSMGKLWTKARELGISRKGSKEVLIRRIRKAMEEASEGKSSKVSLTELQRLAPPSFSARKVRIDRCPRKCPNIAKQNECTPENCIEIGKRRPEWKEVYFLAKEERKAGNN